VIAAHIGAAPLEEILPLLAGPGAGLVAVRAWLGLRLRRRDGPASEPHRSAATVKREQAPRGTAPSDGFPIPDVSLLLAAISAVERPEDEYVGRKTFAPHSISVLPLDGEGIAEITAFLDAEQIPRFGLPDEIEPE
jgi:hypothetical protein